MTGTSFSPPTLAKHYKVGVHKILGRIKSGELRAINVSSSATGQASMTALRCVHSFCFPAAAFV